MTLVEQCDHYDTVTTYKTEYGFSPISKALECVY